PGGAAAAPRPGTRAEARLQARAAARGSARPAGPDASGRLIPAFDASRDEEQDTGRGRRAPSRLPMFAAVGIAIAVVGVGAGALLSTGGDDDGGQDDQAPVSASAPAAPAPSGSASASPSGDPVAKGQAAELDALLLDSNDSRASVIASVGKIRACQDLGTAAKDLRAAAGERNSLVTRLDGVEIGKLPSNVDLKASLRKAWQASAEADNHYAAWADQMAGKRGCKKGKARNTPQTAQAEAASGRATQAKERAAYLWNMIAKEHGLTTHTKEEL
ncbi:hypothetical protein ACFWEG_22935, partial [Streptomyces sp. NPDC060194]